MSGAEGREYDRGGRKPGMGVFLELLTGMRRVGVGVVKPVGNQVSTYLGGNFESDRSSFTVIRGLSDMQYLRVFFGRRGAILFFSLFLSCADVAHISSCAVSLLRNLYICILYRYAR